MRYKSLRWLASTLLVAAVSLFSGCASRPDNVDCNAETRMVDQPVCKVHASRKTGTVADRYCDARNVCNTTYRDVYETQCTWWGTERVEKSVCRWSCKQGFSALPGLDANSGCYAGEELTRLSALQTAKLAKAAQERKQMPVDRAAAATIAPTFASAAFATAKRSDQQYSAGAILSNCVSIEAFFPERLLQPWHQDGFLGAAAKETANATRQIASWAEMKRLLLTDRYYPMPCWVVGVGQLPKPEHINFYLMASDVGDKNFNTVKVAYYYELWPRGSGFIPPGYMGRDSWLRYGSAGSTPEQIEEVCKAIASNTDPVRPSELQRRDERAPNAMTLAKLKAQLDFDQSGVCLSSFPAYWASVEKAKAAERKSEFGGLKRRFNDKRPSSL